MVVSDGLVLVMLLGMVLTWADFSGVFFGVMVGDFNVVLVEVVMEVVVVCASELC